MCLFLLTVLFIIFLFNQKFTTLLIINHRHAKITQKSFNATIDCKNEDILQYQLVGEIWKKVN
jgi:hypothetical protein